ncbi:MAG: oligoendopeptidase F [Clostridiales bacterium]|nr:oligoendopeptidase F [Clostridiales bacterium]
MYRDAAAWNEDLAKVKDMAGELAGYAGRLGESSAVLLESLRKKDDMNRLLEKVFVFARMKRDEDNANEEAQAMTDKVMAAVAGIGARQAFFVPELIGLGEETIGRFLDEEPGLAVYRFYLECVLREKEHVLSDAEESLLARLSEVTSATDDIFTMLNNADLDFGEITGEDGKPAKLTHGSYITFLQSRDRRVRQEAFEKMYAAYKSHINTIGATYAGSVKMDVIGANIRHYSSARDAACFADNVSEDVYDNLIQVINDNLPALHKYLAVRKRALGVGALRMWDMYAPLVDVPDRDIPYEEAVAMAKEVLSPLGKQYISDLSHGFEDGWVDVYETPGKTSGAYSFGCYDSKPFVLLNYKGKLQDVFTLVHEMGHSMNSFYTRKTQPHIYGSHSIFTAEVASTVNENLLIKHLLATEKDPEMRKYLINFQLEGFRTTVFRQTMFAEFEHLVHRHAEEGESITPAWLCQTYNALNNKYFGPDLVQDDLIQYEWARIPHFYSAFYVYKYATGYSAAAAISDLILKDGPENYLQFLACGENDYPVELLKIAGVDMSQPAPIESAMKTFSALVDELDTLL